MQMDSVVVRGEWDMCFRVLKQDLAEFARH